MDELIKKFPEGKNKKVVLAAIRERILFNYFREMYPDFKITHMSKVEGVESWDAVIQSGGTNYLVEIKVRDKEKFWDNWIFEEYKYNKLIELSATDKAKQNKLQVMYINFFQDGAIIWNQMGKEAPFFFDRDSIKTCIGDKSRTIKSVAYMKNLEGSIYNYKNNIKEVNNKAIEVFKNLWPGEDLPKDGLITE